ncbi:DUF1378 family protein [Lonsdalea quercina]|uniref:DUF1378 family protein n=1 Tax=Lonsdalea quercina TaxID=71657 RepID=UPI003975C7A9
MTFIETIMLYFSTFVSILYLIAGGWVAVRNWLKSKAAAKEQAQADAFELAVQERLKKLQEEADASPEQTATSTAGSVAE